MKGISYSIHQSVVILLITLGSTFSFSQEYSLSGKIVSENDSLIYGSVLFLNPSDSSLIKGSYAQKGVFLINALSEPKGMLLIRSSGYKDTTIVISNPSLNDLNIGIIEIELAVLGLDDVSVVGKIPLFETSDEGGLVVNVQNTLLASSTSLLDVLSKSPNVIVSGGSVSIFGKGEALIYIDGAPTQFDQLAGIPVSQVKKIEIISNPSARYDADGRAVINIYTIDYHSTGWQGTVLHNSILARSYIGKFNLNLNYRTKKWSFSLGYGLLAGRDWEKLDATRSLTLASVTFLSENAHLNENRLTNFSTYNFGVDYTIDSIRKVTMEYRGYFNILDLNESVANNIFLASGERNTLNTQNDGRNTKKNNSIVINYTSKLDTIGSNLFYGAQYSQFDGRLNDKIREDYFVEDTLKYSSDRDSKGSTNISIFTTQLDYVKKYTESSYLEAGAKYARAHNEGKIDFYSRQVGETSFELIQGFSNDFTYKENVPAAYFQYWGTITPKISFNVGTRAEFTKVDGFSRVSNLQVIDTTYFNIFPTTSVLAKLSEAFSIGLSYSSRINRPQYQELDPFIEYQDSLTSFQGNPFLVPERTQAFELNFNMLGFNFLKIGYNHSKNSFRSLVEQGSNGINSVVLRTINVDQLDSYFATFSIPVDLKGYSSFTTASITFDKITDGRPEFVSNKILPRLYIYSYHKLNVKNWFSFELFGAYMSKQDDGIYLTESNYYLSCGVSKSFLKNKNLSLRIMANDILSTNRSAGNFEIGATRVVYDNRFNTNFYQLMLTYKFGKLKEATFKAKDTGEEEKGRIK